MLVWSALTDGAHQGLPLATSIILIATGVLCATIRGVSAGGVTWRRTALDGPLALCGLLIVVQMMLGNRRLVAWALGPPAPPVESFPTSPIVVGTAAPAQTLAALVLFLAYVAVYYLVVLEVRDRRHFSRLVRLMLVTGAVLAFGALVDYLSGDAWIFAWRDGPLGGRLSAAFANPDHFATWLAMLICLGGGYVMAARAPSGRISLGDIVASRALRDEALQRALPFIASGVMLLALVFTLSRGAIVGVLGALLVLVSGSGIVAGIPLGRRSDGRLAFWFADWVPDRRLRGDVRRGICDKRVDRPGASPHARHHERRGRHRSADAIPGQPRHADGFPVRRGRPRRIRRDLPAVSAARAPAEPLLLSLRAQRPPPIRRGDRCRRARRAPVGGVASRT